MQCIETHKAIQQALQDGSLSEALDLLLECTAGKNKHIKEDVFLLKSKFEYSRNQYEIKGTLTDKEFNLAYSKTVIGIQDILDRLRKPEAYSLEVGQSKPDKKENTYKGLMLILMLILVLGISYYSYHSWYTGENKVDTKLAKEEMVPLDSNLQIGNNNQQNDFSSGRDTAPQQSAKPKDGKINQSPSTNKLIQKVSEDEKIVIEPPAKMFKIKLVMNSNMSNASIFVDGKPATIISSTPIVTTIQLAQKQTMHVLELRQDHKSCKRERLITADNQRIIFNCP